MTLYVDRAVWPWRDRLWAHLVSDSGPDELHRAANAVGKPRVSFQGDHYDLHEEQRARALDLGAVAVDSREIVRVLRRTGQRLPPSRRRFDWRWTHDDPRVYDLGEAPDSLTGSVPGWLVNMVRRALRAGFGTGARMSLAVVSNTTSSVTLVRGAIPSGGPGPAQRVLEIVGPPLSEAWATLTDEGPLLELLVNRPVPGARP